MFFPYTKKNKSFAREAVMFGIAAEAKRLGLEVVPREGFVLAADK